MAKQLNKKKTPKRLYFVWENDTNDDIDGGYYAQFDSITDAVSTAGDGCEVFSADLKRVGVFRRDVCIVKIRNKRKSDKKLRKKK